MWSRSVTCNRSFRVSGSSGNLNVECPSLIMWVWYQSNGELAYHSRTSSQKTEGTKKIAAGQSLRQALQASPQTLLTTKFESSGSKGMSWCGTLWPPATKALGAISNHIPSRNLSRIQRAVSLTKFPRGSQLKLDSCCQGILRHRCKPLLKASQTPRARRCVLV